MANSSSCIYTLECQGGRVYVGRCRSDRVQDRIDQHMSGNGAEFTRRYKPERLLDVKESENPFDEDAEVLSQMNARGINNVRGGSYSNINLRR